MSHYYINNANGASLSLNFVVANGGALKGEPPKSEGELNKRAGGR